MSKTIYPIFNPYDFQQPTLINSAVINSLSSSNITSSSVSLVDSTGSQSNVASEPWVSNQINDALNTLSGGTLQTSLNTILKIDQAINNDPNFYTDITTSINNVLTEANTNQTNISNLETRLTNDELNITNLQTQQTTNTNNINTIINTDLPTYQKLLIYDTSPTLNSTNIVNSGNLYNTFLNYLLSSTASSTYQTISGMSSYLTSTTASSTYQTISGMSSYLLSSTASSTYAPLLNAVLNVNEISENVYNGGTGSSLSLSYTGIKGIIYFTPSANFTLTLTNIPASNLSTYSITLIYNVKFYANYISVNGSAITMISGGGLSNISINSSATYVMQQINICFLNSSTPIVITNVLSLF